MSDQQPIIRVFPRRTSYTPVDDWVFYGPPPMRALIPEHSEVHISCTFIVKVPAKRPRRS